MENFGALEFMFVVVVLNFFGWAFVCFKNNSEQNKHGFKMANVILWVYTAVVGFYVNFIL